MTDNLRALLWFLVALALSLTVGFAYWVGLQTGQAEATARWRAERATAARQQLDAWATQRQRELDLQATVDRLRRDHHEAINRAVAQRDAALRELRHRPERPPSYVPTTETAGAQPSAACGADRLYRDDAAFLVGLAADADTIRESLTECRAAYAAAQIESE